MESFRKWLKNKNFWSLFNCKIWMPYQFWWGCVILKLIKSSDTSNKSSKLTYLQSFPLLMCCITIIIHVNTQALLQTPKLCFIVHSSLLCNYYVDYEDWTKFSRLTLLWVEACSRHPLTFNANWCYWEFGEVTWPNLEGLESRDEINLL